MKLCSFQYLMEVCHSDDKLVTGQKRSKIQVIKPGQTILTNSHNSSDSDRAVYIDNILRIESELQFLPL